MSEGAGALGFAQTPETNYDSILKAQSQINRQAASMVRTQMSQIQRADVQAAKAAKEQQERIEELTLDATVNYAVPYQADILGDLATQIAVDDTKPMMARAQQGLIPTMDQSLMVNEHKNMISSFSAQVNDEIKAMNNRGYYNIPAFKEAYSGHLKALANGEVTGDPITIVSGAPTPMTYMFGSQDAFRPLNEELMSSFLVEPKYWTYWFDANAQEQKESYKVGGQQGAKTTTESVSATTTQFSVYDQSIKKIRPKSAEEIINEGLLDSWFSNKENIEGSILLRRHALEIIAENKANEQLGIGSDYIVIEGERIKISDIDSADNGTPLAFTYLMAQSLSDIVYKYGMDNSALSVSETERLSLSIINRIENQGVTDAAYQQKFNLIGNLLKNNNNILGQSTQTMVGGVAMFDISDMFPGVRYQNNNANVFYNPETQSFRLQYEKTSRGRTKTITTESMSVNEFVEGSSLFPGYSYPTASKYLAKIKAYGDAGISASELGGSNPTDTPDMTTLYKQVANEWQQNVGGADDMADAKRAAKTLLRSYDNAIPTKSGTLINISIDSEIDETFDVMFDIDGTKKTIKYTFDELKELYKQIAAPSLGQSSSVGQFDGLPLSPEQLKLLNRIG